MDATNDINRIVLLHIRRQRFLLATVDRMRAHRHRLRKAPATTAARITMADWFRTIREATKTYAVEV